jgi:hypothetical protein
MSNDDIGMAPPTHQRAYASPAKHENLAAVHIAIDDEMKTPLKKTKTRSAHAPAAAEPDRKRDYFFIVSTVASTILSLADVGTDVLVLIEFFNLRNWGFFAFSVACE